MWRAKYLWCTAITVTVTSSGISKYTGSNSQTAGTGYSVIKVTSSNKSSV